MSKQTEEIREMLESFAKREKKEREDMEKKLVNYFKSDKKDDSSPENNQNTEFGDGFFLESKFRHMRISKQEQDLFAKELKELMKKYKVFALESNLIHKF